MPMRPDLDASIELQSMTSEAIAESGTGFKFLSYDSRCGLFGLFDCQEKIVCSNLHIIVSTCSI